MIHVYIFISLFVFCCDLTLCAYALSVEISQKLSGNEAGLLGDNGTKIECLYTRENIEQFFLVSFMAFNRSSITFETIATYIPDQTPLLHTQGQYLIGRLTLTPITQLSTKAVITFNKLMCIDDTFYKCQVSYLDSSGSQNQISNNISISVQVPPSKPDGILLLNMQITPTPVITDGDNVTFVCTGNVGKPPEKFIFQKYRRGHILPLIYTSANTSIQELSDNCSYYRTSNITLQVTADDNKAVIRYAVVSPVTDMSMYVESKPLEIYYAVRMPTLIKDPNKTDYLLGLDSRVDLTCTTDGNPKPSYLWYKDNQIEAISTSKTFTIEDVTKTNGGIYTCVVINAFNNVNHTKRVHIFISIINEANDPQINENTAAIVVGTVCGSIILVLCAILFGVIQNKNKCLLMRNHNDRSLDYVNAIQQQDLSLYEGVGHALDVHHYEQPSTGEHQYTNTNLSSN